MVHYSDHKILSLDLILSRFNLVHTIIELNAISP
jgi:hypothetical protein